MGAQSRDEQLTCIFAITSSSFQPVLSIHCLTEVYFGTGVEQPIDCLNSHHPEPSGREVHREVGGLDIGGQHCRRFVLLRHTHRPQKGPYPICVTTDNLDSQSEFRFVSV